MHRLGSLSYVITVQYNCEIEITRTINVLTITGHSVLCGYQSDRLSVAVITKHTLLTFISDEGGIVFHRAKMSVD